MAFNSDEYRNRLQELGGSDFEIADGEPDIRGWSVKTYQGEILGDVDELIFDVESRKVRYIVLDLDDNEWDLDSRTVLVPIGIAELDEDDDDVILPNITAEQLKSLPDYDEDNLSQETELQIRSIFGGVDASTVAAYSNDFYDHRHFDETNLFKNRPRSSDERQTVIGIFSSSSQAQSAVQRLRSAGFVDSNIDLSDRTSAADDDANDSSISSFFGNLFGNDDEARSYSEAAKRSTLVTVHAQSPDEAERAARILDEYGAIDVDERTGESYKGSNPDTNSTTDGFQSFNKSFGSESSRLKSRIFDRRVDDSSRLRSTSWNDRSSSNTDFRNKDEGL